MLHGIHFDTRLWCQNIQGLMHCVFLIRKLSVDCVLALRFFLSGQRMRAQISSPPGRCPTEHKNISDPPGRLFCCLAKSTLRLCNCETFGRVLSGITLRWLIARSLVLYLYTSGSPVWLSTGNQRDTCYVKNVHPDRTFHNFRASKSTDWRFWSTQNSSTARFWGSIMW